MGAKGKVDLVSFTHEIIVTFAFNRLRQMNTGKTMANHSHIARMTELRTKRETTGDFVAGGGKGQLPFN